MFNGFKNLTPGKAGIFAAGLLVGTAGIKLLTSKDAKKFYTVVTAAFLRARDGVMKTTTTLQENAGDILAEAKQINRDREEACESETVPDAEEEQQ